MQTKLINLLTENEELYEINCYTDSAIYIIGPETDNVDRELDVSGCIEDTLHRMIDATFSEDEIYEILRAEKLNGVYDDENDYYIDLDYIIHNFFPTGVIKTGIVYTRPTSTYTAHHKSTLLCKNISIFDDATDDEILMSMHEKFGINQDLYIVQDMIGDGSIYGIQSLAHNGDLFILKRNVA